MLQDDPSQDVFYAYNNIIINGVGTQGYEHHQSYILESLMPHSMYEAQIQAKNKFGWSAVSEKFQFHTNAYGKDKETFIYIMWSLNAFVKKLKWTSFWAIFVDELFIFLQMLPPYFWLDDLDNLLFQIQNLKVQILQYF